MRLDVVYNELITDPQYEHIAFIKVNANDRANQELTTAYQVRFVPTLFTFNNKEMVWQHVGAIDEVDLRAQLELLK